MDSIDRYGNSRQPVDRLVSAWDQGSGVPIEPVGEPDDPLIKAAVGPRRRTRTPLTDEDVDAMRTARANRSSVTALALRFGVHRGTVWAKTRRA